MTAGRAWLALLRPPNFLTVPGDVLAGCFLAVGAGAGLGKAGLWPMLAAAVVFYAAGLLLNDWADAGIDAVERPERPIPSGAVSRGAVGGAGFCLLLSGVGLCLLPGGATASVGAGLAAAIATYNLFAKNVAWLGPWNMGLCRGLSFLLGAALVPGAAENPLVVWGAVTVTLYIAAVTHLARREVGGRYFWVERWLPAGVFAASFFGYLPLSRLIDWPGQAAVGLCFFLATGGASRVAGLLPGRRATEAGRIPTPALIGRLIALLLPFQAACVAGSGDGRLPLALAAALLVLWPVKRWMGKIFYSS